MQHNRREVGFALKLDDTMSALFRCDLAVSFADYPKQRLARAHVYVAPDHVCAEHRNGFTVVTVRKGTKPQQFKSEIRHAKGACVVAVFEDELPSDVEKFARRESNDNRTVRAISVANGSVWRVRAAWGKRSGPSVVLDNVFPPVVQRRKKSTAPKKAKPVVVEPAPAPEPVPDVEQ